MDLHYFPLWEGEVHDVLQECFGDLQSIFAFYCKACHMPHTWLELNIADATQPETQFATQPAAQPATQSATQSAAQPATHAFEPPPRTVHRRRGLCGGGGRDEHV